MTQASKAVRDLVERLREQDEHGRIGDDLSRSECSMLVGALEEAWVEIAELRVVKMPVRGSMVIPAKEIARLRALEAAATPAPWSWNALRKEICAGPNGDAGPNGEAIVETDSGVYPPHEADATLIIEARNALPALLRCANGDEAPPR